MKSFYIRVFCMLVFFLAFKNTGFAQSGNVGIGTRTPDSSAMLDIVSTDKGLLIPRFHIADTTNPSPVTNPKEGLLVYNNGFVPGDVTRGNGFYYWTTDRGGRWVYMLSGGAVANVIADTLKGDSYIIVTGGDDAVLKPVGLALDIQVLSDTLVSQQYFKDSIVSIMNNNIVKIIRDSTTAWYVNNTVLHDSIFNTVVAKSDTLKGDNYVTVIGGDNSVLSKVELFLNLQVVRDSLVNNQIFRDSIINIVNNDIVQTIKDSTTAWYTNNTVLHDSIFNTVVANSDSLVGDNYISVAGGDSSVLSRVDLALNLQAVSDSLVSQSYFRDSITNIVNNDIVQTIRDSTTEWYTNNTVLHDSIFNTVVANSDSLVGDDYIVVSGGDSSVLDRVDLALDLQRVSDSLVSQSYFRDSITNIVNNDIVQTIRDSTTAWYTNNTILHDSVFNTVVANSDSLVGDSYIQVKGGDSSVLSRVELELDMDMVRDSLVSNQIFRDSITNIVNNDIVQTIRDSTTEWYTNNTVLHDSIFNTVVANSDSLVGDDYIVVSGGDSSVLDRVDLALDLQRVSDSLVSQSYFRDSITNIVNNDIVQTIRDSTTAWYTNNTILHDSVFNTVVANSDSLVGDNYISVIGGDSSVLSRVDVALDIDEVADSVSVRLKTDTVLIDSVRLAPRAFGGNIQVITDANYTIAADDYTVVIKGMTADRTINLPDPTTCYGRVLNITQMSHPHYVMFNHSVFYSDSEQHNYLYSAFGLSSGTNYKITIQSDGTQWYAISNQ